MDNLHNLDVTRIVLKYINPEFLKYSISLINKLLNVEATKLVNLYKYYITWEDLMYELCYFRNGLTIDTLLEFGIPVKNIEYSIIKYAAQSGNLGNLKYFCQYKNKDIILRYPTNICSEVIKSGNLDSLEHFFTDPQQYVGDREIDEFCMYIAARYNYLDCLTFLHENGGNINYSLSIAACNGNLECLRYLVENNIECDNESYTEALTFAARFSHKCFKYLYNNLENVNDILKTNMFTEAYRVAHLKNMIFLKNNECTIDLRSCSDVHRIVTKQHFTRTYNIDQWISEYSEECMERYNYEILYSSNISIECFRFIFAVSNGNVGLMWTPEIYFNNCHNLEFMKYLYETEYAEYGMVSWDEGTCISAAGYSSPECLRYLRENIYEFGVENQIDERNFENQIFSPCPWNIDVYFAAIEYDSIECLKYAHENGCPWDRSIYDGAVENNSLKCIEYIKYMISLDM